MREDERVLADTRSGKTIRLCAPCPMYRHKRGVKKKALLYYPARALEKTCCWCHRANREIGKGLRKSRLV
jgi:hypothetical protein